MVKLTAQLVGLSLPEQVTPMQTGRLGKTDVAAPLFAVHVFAPMVPDEAAYPGLHATWQPVSVVVLDPHSVADSPAG